MEYMTEGARVCNNAENSSAKSIVCQVRLSAAFSQMAWVVTMKRICRFERGLNYSRGNADSINVNTPKGAASISQFVWQCLY